VSTEYTGKVKMRKSFVLMLLVLSLVSVVMAEEGKFGIGVILGEPTGLSMKMLMSKTTAIAGALAWSFSGAGYLDSHADYLCYKYDLIKVKKGELPVYFGPGVHIGFGSSILLGIRGVVGMDYIFSNAPWDIFIEVVPILELIPGTGLGFNTAIGTRYFFK
jgi:hypothetical protein